MSTPAADAIGKLDGRNPDAPGYPPLNWVGVSLYREVELGEPTVVRPEGADPGRKPGELWWTPSALDKITGLAEVLVNRYHGQTAWDMIAGLFAVLVEGHDPADVRNMLGLPEPGSPE